MALKSPAQKATANKRKADARKEHLDRLRFAKREYGIPLRRAAVVPITTPSHFTILVASPEVQKHFFLAPTAADFPASNGNATTGVAMDSVVVEPSPQLMLSGGFLNVAVATGYLPSGIQRDWFDVSGKQVDGQSCSLYRMLKEKQHKALIYSICSNAQVMSDALTIRCINEIITFTNLFFIPSNCRLQIDPTTLPSILYTPKPTLEARNVCSNYYGDNDANKAHEAITSLRSSLSVIQEAGGFPTKYGYSHCASACGKWYRARYPIDLCRQPIDITTQELTVQEWSAITKMRNAPFYLWD
jgi:hypothetical protein